MEHFLIVHDHGLVLIVNIVLI